MKIEEIVKNIENLCKIKNCPPLYLQGPSGIGKTAAIRLAAKNMGIECKIINLTSCEAVDLRGLPRVKNGATTWASPLPKTGKGILVLDELSSAPRDVQIAAHHILQSEPGSDVGIGDGWYVVATGNRSIDKTVYYSMGAPLRNRLVIIDAETDIEKWQLWAENNSVSREVRSFLRFKPGLFFTDEPPNVGAFPSPRAWVNASRILQLNNHELICGAIGEGAAIEFRAYLNLYKELPSIDEIVAFPSTSKVPENLGVKFAAIELAASWSCINGRDLMAYVGRFPNEFVAMYIYKIRDKVKLKSCPDIVFWLEKNSELFSL